METPPNDCSSSPAAVMTSDPAAPESLTVPLSLATQALHKACRQGRLLVVEDALRNGAQVNAHDDENGHTAFHHLGTCKRRTPGLHEALLQRLLAAGGDLNALSKDGDPPTFVAASQQRWDLVDLMVRHGASVATIPVGTDGHHGSWGHHSLLSWAVQQGPFGSVRRLLDHGADVNASSNNGDTALALGLWTLGPMQNIKIIRRLNRVIDLLLERGASVTGPSGSDPLSTPLGVVVKENVTTMLDRFIKAGAWHGDPRWNVTDNQVALTRAAIDRNHPEALARLFDEGLGRTWSVEAWEALVRHARAVIAQPAAAITLPSDDHRPARRTQVLAMLEGQVLRQFLAQTHPGVSPSDRVRPRL